MTSTVPPVIRTARRHLTYANAMATVAVFIALSGSAYAATKLQAKSVGTRELKNGAVTKSKIAKSTLTALTRQSNGVLEVRFRGGGQVGQNWHEHAA